ncbi:MAG TPA: 2-phospho-L-lactate guanylyltransferase [Terriglobia bacterium]|nr:2-phospho-L-lactate guanylyltransferase [Terriglobia bacterium]
MKRDQLRLNAPSPAESGMILIPVKGFETAKQRLAPLLSAGERPTFARAMLEDVLRSLADCSNCPPVALITSDPSAQQVVLRFGCEIIEDGDALSETQAVAAAARACIERGATRILVIPGDIPLVDGREIRAVLDALPGSPDAPGAVLVPAHDGRGTNAALLRPPGLFDLRFGNDSFEPHLRVARERSRLCQVLRLPGIGLDIDNPGDLAELLQVETRTDSQKLLRSWNVRDRLQLLHNSDRQKAWGMTP